MEQGPVPTPEEERVGDLTKPQERWLTEMAALHELRSLVKGDHPLKTHRGLSCPLRSGSSLSYLLPFFSADQTQLKAREQGLMQFSNRLASSASEQRRTRWSVDLEG